MLVNLLQSRLHFLLVLLKFFFVLFEHGKLKFSFILLFHENMHGLCILVGFEELLELLVLLFSLLLLLYPFVYFLFQLRVVSFLPFFLQLSARFGLRCFLFHLLLVPVFLYLLRFLLELVQVLVYRPQFQPDFFRLRVIGRKIIGVEYGDVWNQRLHFEVLYCLHL